MNQKWRILSSQVFEIYKEIDLKIKTLVLKYPELKCPVGCGKCCKSPNIYTSPLEMIPLALKVIEENNVEKVLAQIEQNEKQCIFFSSREIGDSCSVYKDRALICRLFGWTKVGGKNGDRMSICKYQSNVPEINLDDVPRISFWAQRIADLDPSVGATSLPINLALKEMIEKILLSGE